MSLLSARLVPDDDKGIILAANKFIDVLTVNFNGIRDTGTARAFLDRHIESNGGLALTDAEVAEIGVIKTHYNTLSAANKAAFLHKVRSLTTILQEDFGDPVVTEAWWDNQVGLGL